MEKTDTSHLAVHHDSIFRGDDFAKDAPRVERVLLWFARQGRHMCLSVFQQFAHNFGTKMHGFTVVGHTGPLQVPAFSNTTCMCTDRRTSFCSCCPHNHHCWMNRSELGSIWKKRTSHLAVHHDSIFCGDHF